MNGGTGGTQPCRSCTNCFAQAENGFGGDTVCRARVKIDRISEHRLRCKPGRQAGGVQRERHIQVIFLDGKLRVGEIAVGIGD